MPRIHVKTNVYLNKEKKLTMMKEMKQVIDFIPWEKGDFLMADFEDECEMMFGDDFSQPCAAVEISLIQAVYQNVSPKIHEKVLACLTEIVSRNGKIPADRIFVLYKNSPLWALGGDNVEKTIVKVGEEGKQR